MTLECILGKLSSMKTKTLSPEAQAKLDETIAKLPSMNISDIANVCRRDWTANGGKIYFGAKPYLDAMQSMDKITDNFGYDDGRSIVLYFLGNAQTWRGPVAKAVKAELHRRLKAK